MEPEGLVHALEQIHRLLAPGGILVDVHNTVDPPLFEVVRDGVALYCEPEPGFCEDVCLEAQKALDQAVERGLFALEDTRRIEFFVVADSVAELQAFQKEFYAYAGSAELTEDEQQLLARLEEAMETAGPGAQVATHEIGIVSRLTRTGGLDRTTFPNGC